MAAIHTAFESYPLRIGHRVWSEAFAPVNRVCGVQTLALRNRSAFPITDTELKAMAAAAITGVRSSPQDG